MLLDRDIYPERRDRSDVRVGLAADLIYSLADNRVDVVVLNDAPPEFGRRIVPTGRRIYCVDPAADHAFVRDVQLRAADLAPFLRRMRGLQLERLRR